MSVAYANYDYQVQFHYERVGLNFSQRIATHYLLANESVVLLGPRYIGKRYILSDVERLLRQAGEKHLVALRLLERNWNDSDELLHVVCEALKTTLSDFAWKEPDSLNELEEGLRRFLECNPCHLIVLAADVDALPDHVARRLLKAIQSFVKMPESSPGQFTALLTGSVGLAPLVHGAESDFACATQFVIQGFDRQAFGAYMDGITAAGGGGFRANEQCQDEFFKLCGGNVYLLRALLTGVIEGRRVRRDASRTAITVQEARDAAKYLYSPGDTAVDFMSHAFSRIENSPRAAEMVAGLVENGSFPLPGKPAQEPGKIASTPPTEVELCGLATRQDGSLTFASPVIENIARQHFTQWRLGDLFARSQKWAFAFSHYDKAAAPGRYWVYSPVHRPQLSSAERAFEAALHARAASGVQELNRFFLKGARYVLGFEEVSFWHFLNNSWQPAGPATRAAETPEIRARSKALLPAVELLHSGLHPLEEDDAPFALLVGLPYERPKDRLAVILSNFRQQVPLTRERHELCAAAIENFCSAFTEARRISRVESETEMQRHLLETIPAILDAMEGGHVSTLTALQAAADRLRDIGYRRVMFSMVGPERKHIKGVFDSRPEGESDIALPTDWPLTGPVEDVQQYCVLTRERLVIEDASTHPLTNKHVVDIGEIESLVIIPIIGHGEVLGTIHFERNDKKLPPDSEIRALEYFAEQLAKVIRLIEKGSMLEAAVDVAKEPLLVLDGRDRVRYLNSRAAEQIGLDAGWQNENALPDGRKWLLPKSLLTVDQALSEDRPVSTYIHGTRGKKDEWTTLFAAPIYDWRTEKIGAALQAHDLTAIRRLLLALVKLAACPDTHSLLRGLLDATQQLGHEWGRLYLICSSSGDLVGHMQYGFPERSPEAAAFARGEVILPCHNDPGTESWLCLKRGKPIVFSHDPSREDRESYTTESGLPALSLLHPACPDILKKRPGDVWIDFPLSWGGSRKPLGKLSLACSSNFDPERFELLTIMAEVTSALLAATAQHEAWTRELVFWEHLSMEKAIGVTAHFLRARMAALGLLKLRYDKALGRVKRIAKLNAEFGDLLGSLQKDLDHVTERLRPITPKREEAELLSLIRATLRQQLPESRFNVMPRDCQIMADVDRELFGQVLAELAANARKAIRGGSGLRINVLVRVTDEGSSSRCTIEFSDNGPGIDESQKHLVFKDMYSQWPKQERGSGLGLGFVRRAIEAHNGTVKVGTSRKGACFILEFARLAEMSKETAQ